MNSHLTTTGAGGGGWSFCAYCARRSFWLLMLIVHVGAFPAAWAALFASEAHVARLAPVFRLAGLVVAAIFCGLKVVDANWVRFNPGWRSGVSAMLVIALLHISVIERIEQGEIAFSHAHLGVFLIAGALVESQTVRRALRHLAHKLAASSPSRTAREHLASFAPVWQRWFVPHLDPHWRGPCTPRAPPSC